jgi:hypothetical protein
MKHREIKMDIGGLKGYFKSSARLELKNNPS